MAVRGRRGGQIPARANLNSNLALLHFIFPGFVDVSPLYHEWQLMDSHHGDGEDGDDAEDEISGWQPDYVMMILYGRSRRVRDISYRRKSVSFYGAWTGHEILIFPSFIAIIRRNSCLTVSSWGVHAHI